MMRITRNSALLGGGALVVGVTAAVAGNGVGGVFNLGETNTVDATTQLSGAPRAPQLHVINNSRQSGAAGVRATAGRAGVNYGVYATTASPTGYAGYFQNTSTSTSARGRGIRSLAAGALPTLFDPSDGAAGGEFAGPNGLIGVASHPAGAGVIGRSASADGFAGFFQNSSTTTDAKLGRGIRSLAAGALPTLFNPGDGAAGGEFAGPNGVIGVASHPAGAGIVGRSGQGRFGVYGGASAAPNDIGVYGFGGKGISGEGVDAGVYGFSSVTIGVSGVGETIGVRGQGKTYGVYSAGNAHVQGNLSKTTGTFKIDHPQDPANKYMSHSFVESPDMMNIYNGNVVTDATGAAVVELPSYFEALNRDPRYQLTVIGSPVVAYIAKEISGNAFSIRTEQPNVKVSWQVTGIRRDAYAVAHPIVVEEEKALAERGRYLHPEEHGQPADLAIHHAQGMARQQQATLAAPVR